MYIAHTPLGDVEYRLEGTGRRTALLLYGGHTDARTRLGEDYFLEREYQILTVSRPGYGKTPLSTGPTPDKFAKTLSQLLKQLNISQVVVVGISAGGRTAMRFADKYPGMTKKLILQSSISFAPWPNRLLQLTSYIMFNPLIEKYTWILLRHLLRKNPKAVIKGMIAFMTTLNSKRVMSGFSKQQLQELTDIFANLSSGSGFLNDIKTILSDATGVSVPTLIIHSKYDKSVPLEHPILLAQQIKSS